MVDQFLILVDQLHREVRPAQRYLLLHEDDLLL